MLPSKIRDYAELLNRLESALNNDSKMHILGCIENPNGNYPFKKIFIGQGNTKRVLISAGIHGDEPAGIETICFILERGVYIPFLKEWELIFLLTMGRKYVSSYIAGGPAVFLRCYAFLLRGTRPWACCRIQIPTSDISCLSIS